MARWMKCETEDGHEVAINFDVALSIAVEDAGNAKKRTVVSLADGKKWAIKNDVAWYMERLQK